MNIPMLILQMFVAAIAVFLTTIWLNIEWWKPVVLFLLYGWAFNLDKVIYAHKSQA